MKPIVFFALIGAIVSGCAAPKTNIPTTADVMILQNYIPDNNAYLSDTTNFFFFNNADDFDKVFSMTKSSPGNAFVPDFDKQSVFAIILPTSEKVISMQILSVRNENETLDINYLVTDTASWKSYPQAPALVGVVPKSSAVKQVSFYRNKVKERTLSVVTAGTK